MSSNDHLHPDGTNPETIPISDRQNRLPSLARSFEMDDSAVLEARSNNTRLSTTTTATTTTGSQHSNLQRRKVMSGAARHTLGLCLLLVVVFLWTLSNFLGSSIFADNSYAKPFFLTYLNTSTFAFAMVPSLVKSMYNKHKGGRLRSDMVEVFSWESFKALWSPSRSSEEEEEEDEDDGIDHDGNDRGGRGGEREAFLKPTNTDENNMVPNDEPLMRTRSTASTSSEKQDSVYLEEDEYLPLIPTARLSLAFCFLWFGANYFAMACLQYTTVASTTILTSTSSVWTLLIGAITGTEKFTWRKLCGVLASLSGIVLISHVDLSSTPPDAENGDGNTNTVRAVVSLVKRALDDFPDKTPSQLLLGDSLALLSAVIYGFYTITLKRSTISAAPRSIHMPTFFGLVGLFNIILLLPLFPILHFTNLEPFAFPPSLHIWTILIGNSISSFMSDICWAYAMVFTSPLVVTVGLSLTIPLSLVGEMIIQGRYEGWIYWVGAMVVVGSFVFVEREEVKEEVSQLQSGGTQTWHEDN